MSIKSFVIAAVVAAGTFGLSDRADAQWRYRYSYPTYSYSYPTYSYSYPTYTYSYPSYTSSSGVVTSGYTPLTNSSGVITTSTMPYYGNNYYGSYYNGNYYGSYYNPYGAYMNPYNAGLNNAYYSGYSNLGGNPYGLSVGTNGGMFMGRRAWRW